jgi:ribosomal protein S18 acetylase RimI-like enzyme
MTEADRPALREAIVVLQEHERRLHASRLPGEQMADAYLAWLEDQASDGGALLIAEIEGGFAGFVAGWIAENNDIAETPDSNRFGYISDICVMPGYRGRRLAARLLEAIEHHLQRSGITRLRLVALAANAAALTAYERAGFTSYEIVYEKEVRREGTS